MFPSADHDAALTFPEGLVGCRDWTTFVMLTDSEEDLPVAYMQLVSDPRVRLLVTDPRLIDDSYSLTLSEQDRAELDLQPSDETVLYSTLTIQDDGMITANLLGPLVINARTRQGRQLVLTDSGYTTRHPVANLQEA
jgi:flagellar assembly factor FliW